MIKLTSKSSITSRMNGFLLSCYASLCHAQNYFGEWEEAYKIFDIKCQLLKYFTCRNRNILDHFKIFSHKFNLILLA